MKHIAVLVAGLFVLSACSDDSDSSPKTPGTDTGLDMAVSDVGSGDMGSQDLGADVSVDMSDPPLLPHDVILPLGETLLLDGDDYLAFWGVDNADTIALTASPAGAQAAVVDGRLTPDIAGEWVLERDETQVTVTVVEDYLTEDTFLNFNYTPVRPLLRTEGAIWVASPPSNAIQRVEIGTDGVLTAAELIPTGSWPVALAQWDSMLVVSQAGRDTLGIVDPALGRVVDSIPVGDEPATVIVDGDIAYVALGGANQVVKVDLTARQVVGRVDVGRKTRAMDFNPTTRRLYAASLISSNAHPLGLLQTTPVPADQDRDIAVIDVDAFQVVDSINAVGTIIRGVYVDPIDDRLLVGVSHSRNDIAGVAADSRPHAHALVEVDIVAGSPTENQVVREINLDQQPSSTGPAASPFSIIRTTARDGTDEVIVSLSASKALLVLDAQSLQEKLRVPTGHDPRGLVIDGTQIFTFAWLENQIERVQTSTVQQSIVVGRDPTPTDVKEGQRIFNDATFSKNRDFSCNNCHIDGITDGLVWNILLDGDVNTLAFRNVSGTGPFLWGGFLPTLFDFSREVLRLVGAQASGEDMEKLTTYMQSVTAPPNPYTLPGGRLTGDQLKGRELFYGRAGCGGCHSGPLFTNTTVVDPAKTDKPTDVPSLIATYDSGPWGREGQWTTIDEMVDFAVDFVGTELSEQERAELASYVSALPADVLYLNASSPQNNSENVFSGVEPELVFSSLLAQGQANQFVFEVQNGETWEAVAGMWTTAGRVARFVPDTPLTSETRYRMTGATGIEGVFGRRTIGEVVVEFGIGQEPLTDVSGSWNLYVSGQVSGDLNLAFLQARGGKVTGALIESNGQIEFDNVQGYVAGNTLYLDPFLADTPFGEVLVNRTEVDLVDGNNDGYAESGTGKLYSIVTLDVTATRLSLPE